MEWRAKEIDRSNIYRHGRLSYYEIFEILEGTETLWSKEKMVIAEILTEILLKIPRIEIVTLEVNCPVRIWRIEFPEEREERLEEIK